MMNASRFRWQNLCHVAWIVALLAAPCVANGLTHDDLTHKDLRRVEHQVVDVVKRVMECTVGLGAPGEDGSGSGVIVNKEGLILTAAHVTQAIGDEVVVWFPSGRKVKAKALGWNANRDAAMAQIIDEGEYPFVEVGQFDRVLTNQWCISLGHAGGFQADRTPPVRIGRILNKNSNRYVATNCTLIGGDSGGPLFDLQGRLIGIHSNIGGSLSENHHVPISVFHQDWKRMLDNKRWGRMGGESNNAERPMLGVEPDKEVEDGVAVKVVPDGPAAKAGLQDGDIIQQVGSRKVNSKRSLSRSLRRKKAGERLKVKVLRGKESLEFEVELVTAAELKGEESSDSSEGEQTEDPPPTEGNTEQPAPPEDLESTNQVAVQNQIIQACRPLVAKPSRSVVRIFRRGRHVVLGTVVSKQGHILTKSSELRSNNFQIELGEGRFVSAKIIERFPKYDLVLLKIDQKLEPVRWQMSQEPLPLGTIVTAAGRGSEPLAFGVISVLERDLTSGDFGFLGVSVKQKGDKVVVQQVQPRSAAAAAGLRVGDQIRAIGGKPVDTVETFQELLKTKKPGSRLPIEFARGGSVAAVLAKLGSKKDYEDQAMGSSYPTGGRLSRNRRNYPNALQTDVPIHPKQCGSPLVDLNGRVLGINIARAGRIKTYTIPASVIHELIADKVGESDLP